MGRKGGKSGQNSKSLKSHKSSIGKFQSKSPSNNSNTLPNADKPNKKKSLKSQRRTNNAFHQQVMELKERNIGASQKGRASAKATPTLDIKPATFQLPSQAQQPATYSVDSLLQGESSVPQPEQKPKKSTVLAVSNRFSLLENDEILEDGTHSILKMDVKPATFSLPSR